MVLTYRAGAAGSASSAKGMAEYLGSEKDVPELAERLAAYLGQTFKAETPAGTPALPKQNMHPLIAELLAIDPTRSLTTAEMTNLLAGNRTDGEIIPGKTLFQSTEKKTRLAYTDFTFSAPKSFSVALVLAPTEAERATLETCWRRANNALLDHISHEIGVVRDRKGNVAEHGHVAVIQYDHYTSRPTIRIASGADTDLVTVPTNIPGDMQRHTHNIVPNVIITDDGRVRAIPLDEIRDRLHEWGAIGHAYLATFLREKGIRAEIDPKTGLSRLPDVPQSACDLYQNRANDGEEHARKYAAGRGLDWDALDSKAKSGLLRGRIMATRRDKDGSADLAAWMKTAADAGYVHQSVLDPSRKQGLAAPEERARVAYEASLPLLEAEWTRRSKLEGAIPRIIAARGMIASGIDTPADIEAVLDAYKTEGVRQDGEMTGIVWGKENGKRFASVTTALHIEQEREAISLMKAAAEDKTAALTAEQIEAAVQRVSAAKGYDFTSEHGQKQKAMSVAFATAGRAIVGIGAAGVGKTVAIEPVIDAYHAAGWQSYGVTLAWRQTHGLEDAGIGKKRGKGLKLSPDTGRLTDAGIEQRCAFALMPFFKAVEDGRVTLNDKTLVVIDEIATIGTRDILMLARLQKETGFKLVGLGDEKQCQAISAGSTINLFRHALGKDQVPELLDTIRQKRIADRETAKLFREGKADEALARKEDAGLLELVPGSYRDTIKAGVDWWEKRKAERADRPDYTIGISVPTNADAHAVGLEVRTRQRADGKLQSADWKIGAADQRGVEYDLALAVGDKVRLFDRVNASFGKGSRGFFGENGTVAEVVSIDKEQGLRLRRADDKVGAIKWKSLQDKETGRIRLAYGHALTIDARQGDTLTDHVTILPAGTKAINGFKMYPADTRNREDSLIVVSHGAEKEEVRNRRPMGDPWLASATDQDMRQAVIENMARNLSRQPEKTLAVDFIDMASDVQRGSVDLQQAAWYRSERAEAAGKEPSLAASFQDRREESATLSIFEYLKNSMIVVKQAFQNEMKKVKVSRGKTEDIHVLTQAERDAARQGRSSSPPMDRNQAAQQAEMEARRMAERSRQTMGMGR